MITHTNVQPRNTAKSTSIPGQGLLLQRKCACGGSASMVVGECEACRMKQLGVQTKLAIGAPGDAYEQEADRVADAVMSEREPSAPGRLRGPLLQRQPADTGPTPPPAEQKPPENREESPPAQNAEASATGAAQPTRVQSARHDPG